MSLLSATPPRGKGIYSRDAYSSEFLSGFDFVVLNAANTRDTGRHAEYLAERGVPYWFYVGPRDSRPDSWQSGIFKCQRALQRHGGKGFLLDPEGGWAGGNASMAEAMGAALGAAAGDTRVGFTSYPSWAYTERVFNAAGGQIFGSPQIYGKTSWKNNRGALVSWYNRWVSIFGAGKLVPSVSLWDGSSSNAPAVITSPALYAQYLSDLPASAGAIAWSDTRGGPAWMQQMYHAHSTGSGFPTDDGPTGC